MKKVSQGEFHRGVCFVSNDRMGFNPIRSLVLSVIFFVHFPTDPPMQAVDSLMNWDECFLEK